MCAILSSAAIIELTGFTGVLQAPESYGVLKGFYYFIKDAGPTLKIFLLLLAAPIWFPIARMIMREINEVLAPEGGLFASKPQRPMHPRNPTEDPFLNVPLASHRRDMHGHPGAASGGPARTGSAFIPSQKSGSGNSVWSGSPRKTGGLSAVPSRPQGFRSRSHPSEKVKRSGF